MAGLEKYYSKRSGDRTPEPYGGGTRGAGSRVFVVQKHAARRLHYDLRLEMDGVLRSWAVPKGPSFDPTVKRFAVMTEDHPLDYKDFEGVIPKGNYGAGAMIVWDQGTWIRIEEEGATLEEGKLLFELRGHKLRGVFTLVKTKKENEWLLIKKPDGWAADEGTREVSEASILSGLTIEDLQQGSDRAKRIRERIEELEVPVDRLDVMAMQTMQAETADAPFSREGWIYELKYDGFRLIAEKDGGRVRLRYRSGKDATHVYPDVVRALKAFPYDRFVIDAEVVVLDEDAKPHIHRLQQRTQLVRKQDIERAALTHPATLYVFDFLAFDDYDLRGLTTVQRKSLLRELIPAQGILRYSDHIETKGLEMFQHVEKMGLEGIMAKRAAARYIGGRSSDWLKMRVERSGEFVIVGYTTPRRETRHGFSSIMLAEYHGRDLVYCGAAGSGFSQAELEELHEVLSSMEIPYPAFGGEVPPTDRNRWIRPELVCEVKYLEFTDERILRHPVFVRMRPDKSPADMMDDDPHFAQTAPEEPATWNEGDEPDRVVPFTNLKKVFWPEEAYTKGDLIEYYRRVSPFLLPYLEDRPVVLTRYPDGINGKNFFQKNSPGHIPGWVRTERMWSEHASREIDYFVADDVESLLYIINMGSIPLHVWSSRVAQIGRPDWTILDLDPKGAPFADVVRIALEIKTLCDEIELPCFPKTSGSTGLHVLIPLGQQCTYEQSRGIAELIARLIVERLPDIATIARNLESRGGKVYVDYGQNGHGRLLVSPYSVRPRSGATVSTPLTWDEVGGSLDPEAFTIVTAPERFESREDPLREVMVLKPDLRAALGRLSERMKG